MKYYRFDTFVNFDELGEEGEHCIEEVELDPKDSQPFDEEEFPGALKFKDQYSYFAHYETKEAAKKALIKWIQNVIEIFNTRIKKIEES